jgi:hypothetical protein
MCFAHDGAGAREIFVGWWIGYVVGAVFGA